MKKNVEKKEKSSIGILQMLKQFWETDPVELSQEEEILKDKHIKEKDRDTLLKALKNADQIMKPTEGIVKSNLAKIRINPEKATKETLEKPRVKTKIIKKAEEKSRE